MARQYGANHLTTNRDYQVQLTNWFEIQIEGTSEDITLMIQSVDLPSPSIEQITLPYGNTVAKVAGPLTFDDSTVRIRDAVSKDIENQLLEWQKQVVDPETGEIGWVDEYKRTMLVTQYGPHGEHERTWKYEGVWPSKLSFGGFDMGSADSKVVDMTLTYDRAFRDN